MVNVSRKPWRTIRGVALPTTFSKMGRPSTWALLILVISATVLPFLPSLRYGFVYDDDVQVLDTVALRSWQSPAAFFVKSVWIPGKSALPISYRYYRPLFFLWLRINAAVFGLHAIWWHLASILVHVAATVLVFFFLRRHFLNPWASTVGALIFGLHPAHIESVAWISGVTDPLAAVGILGSLLLWLRKRESPSVRLQAGALGLYAMALLCKETAVVMPGLVFVYALCGNADLASRPAGTVKIAFREALPYAGVAGLYLGVREALLHSLPQGAASVSRHDVLLSAPSIFLFYLRHLLWPFGLRLFYDFRVVTDARDTGFWVPLAVLGILGFGLLYGLRRRQGVVIPAAAAWVAIPILPVADIALFQRDDFVHDRYLYLPVLALAILCGALLENLVSAAGQTPEKRLVPPCAALLLAGMAGLTAVQSTQWQNNLALYTRAAEHSANTMARNNLASEYAARGRLEEAKTILVGVTQDRPDFWLANYNLGYVNYRLNQLDAAETFLRRSIALNPDDPDGRIYLGLTLFREGRSQEAAAQLREAIAQKADGEGYHFALGIVLKQQGNVEEAKAEFREELRYHPGNGITQMELARMDKDTPGMERQR
jgi:protein O-mannosyl-transferase